MTSPDSTKSPAEVVRAVQDCVTRAFTGDESAMEDLRGLYAEPTYVRHPLSPEIPPLVTRQDFVRHAEGLARNLVRPDSHRAADVVIHETTDPELVVTEFHYEIVVNGATMIMPCIWVTRVRDGRIVEARDYNGAPHPAPAATR
jgi:ketosteroid isomerase-like protein